MKLFDKMLVSAAGLAVYGIAMIVFSGELSSEYSSDKTIISNKTLAKTTFERSSSKQDLSTVEKTDKKKSNGVVVYDKEVDEIIEAYFKNIRNNPVKLEEENRLINDNGNDNSNENEKNSNPEEEAFKAEIKKNSSKKVVAQYRKHVVTEGDSLWRISQKYNVPVYTIISANPEKDKEMIRPGETLSIPSQSGIFYSIKKGDSLSLIAKKFKINAFDIKEHNHLASSTLVNGQKIFLPDAKPLIEFKIVSRSRFIWPIMGKITSGYGMRKHPLNNSMQFHTGLDIAANVGSPIRATAEGVVVYSGDGGTYGNMVILRHKDGYMSIYAHASSLLVKKDQFIKQGQLIAKVGATGVVTGPHLHFEVKKLNSGMDPIQALKEKITTKVAINS